MTTRMGDYGVIDYTPLMELAPRVNSLLEDIGLVNEFNTKHLTGVWAEFERRTLTTTEMSTKARGADRNFLGGDGSRKEMIQIPFFPLDAITVPNEVQGFREIGTEDTPASVEKLVQRKIASLQRSHAAMRRSAQYKALVSNTTYAIDEAGAPIASLTTNYSTLWGAPRNTGTITLGDGAVDPYIALEAARQNVIQKAGDGAESYTMIAIVPSAQFNGIVSHPLVRGAYSQYSSTQEPLRDRLSGNKNNQMFNHKGILLIEDNSGLLTSTVGHVLPLGIDDMFVDAFAPADTIDHANTTAEESYLFMKENYRSTTLESESSYVVMLTRPELITDITFA